MFLLVGCEPRTKIVVPPASLAEWSYVPQGDARPGRHMIRMSDGTRDWEVEFPDVATGYEVRIPLRGAPGMGPGLDPVPARLTAADRELLEERALPSDGDGKPASAARESAADRAAGLEAPARVPARPGPPTKPAAARPKTSYLGGIARIRELYRTRNYELALIDCVDLERQYPNDEKLLAMKGSIYRKLGKNKLARETWEKVLAMDPDNQTVADALRELTGETEEEGGR